MPSERSWACRVHALLLVLGAALLGSLACSDRSHAQPAPTNDPLDRVQLQRNPNRSVPYLALAKPGESAGSATLLMSPLLTIELDGDPLENAYSNLRPIDVDGDGRFEFAQFNGFRFMQVWDAAGEKLWRVANPGGRLHEYEDGTARDTVAVLDLDGDRKQDIAHCGAEGGSAP